MFSRYLGEAFFSSANEDQGGRDDPSEEGCWVGYGRDSRSRRGGCAACLCPAERACQTSNVDVGNINIARDVGVGVAANVIAQVCGVQVNAAVLARQVVRDGTPFVGPVCTTGNQTAPVTVTP
jgi:hypothetical protein